MIETYGAARERLIANGYDACSAIAPDGRVGLGLSGPPPAYFDFQVAQHPPAVRCMPQNDRCRIVALALALPADKVNRARVAAALDKLSLAGGPVRTDSAGYETRVLRVDDLVLSRVAGERPGLDPRIILLGASRERPGAPIISAILPLDGEWRGGDLLRVPRDKLPAIDAAGISSLFWELSAVLPSQHAPDPWQHIPKPAPFPVPPGFEGRTVLHGPTSRRDFLGQESLTEGWRSLYDKLREGPPAESVPGSSRATSGGVSQEEMAARAAAAFPHSAA